MADLDVWSTIAVIVGISACLALPVAWLLAKADEIQRPTIPVPWQPLAQLLGDGDTRMTGQKITNGWRPIETAPRDGQDVLGYDAGFGVAVMRWDSIQEIWRVGQDMLDDPENPVYLPTHWRPLPPPPGEGE